VKPPAAPAEDRAGTLFAGLFGGLLALALLKLGNPVILDPLVGAPKNFQEFRHFAWPVRYGYAGLAVVAAAGLAVLLRKERAPGAARPPAWWLLAGGAWLLWQLPAALATTAPDLTRLVLPHFLAAGVCLALGAGALARVAEPRVFFLALLGGIAGVIAFGLEQQFGGLAETRRFMLEQGGGQLPPELRARLDRGRIFSTLVYPNALAGALLLVLPVAAVTAWELLRDRARGFAAAVTGLLAAGGLGCLVWSGSKAGWLLALGVAGVAWWHAPVRRGLRLGVLALALGAGLALFAVRYRERLADPTSVVARLEYWRAAARGFAARPVTGLGPGGFKDFFARTKPADAEMARLAHNDFLQQAADSGLVGGLAYAAFVWGGLAWLHPRVWRHGDARQRAVWLGLLGWFLQGFVEFGLYLPATAWTAFALFGWLMATAAAAGRPAARAP
jgi:O-antigen ligase